MKPSVKMIDLRPSWSGTVIIEQLLFLYDLNVRQYLVSIFYQQFALAFHRQWCKAMQSTCYSSAIHNYGAV